MENEKSKFDKWDQQLVKPNNIIDHRKFDGFLNVLTGVGTIKDRRTNYLFYGNPRKQIQTLNDMYRSSAITQRIVNLAPDDMTRKPFDIDSEYSKEILEKFKSLQLRPQVNKGLKLARVHGGAVAFYFINDGKPTDQPVDYNNIQSVNYGFTITKDYLQPLILKTDPINKTSRYSYYEQYHEIEAYQITSGTMSATWHKSRCLVFNGIYAGEENKADNGGWCESAIDLYYDEIQMYELVANCAGTLTDNIIQEVIKLKDLNDVLDSDCEGKAIKKLQTLMMAKSVVNKLVLDSEDSFEYNSANISGYSELKDVAKERLSAATGIPQTLLFGQSAAASMGSTTGLSESRNWYDYIQSEQETQLRPQVEKVLMWCKGLLGIPETEIIPFEFMSLFQLDDKTKAEIYKLMSEGDQKYIDSMVLLPSEVAISRFGSGAYSMQTQIDSESREMIENPNDSLE